MSRRLITVVAVGLAWICAGLGLALAGAPERGAGSGEALALVAQAQMRLAAGGIAEGVKLLRRASELAPDDPELAEEFGLALADAGMNDEAIKELRKTGGDLSPSGEATFGVLLAQASKSPAELEAAVKHLEMGVDAVPQGGPARLVLAQSLIRLGKGPEAWEQVRVMLDERPNDPRLFLLAG